jgi:hypothetical protein
LPEPEPEPLVKGDTTITTAYPIYRAKAPASAKAAELAERAASAAMQVLFADWAVRLNESPLVLARDLEKVVEKLMENLKKIRLSEAF